VEHHNHLVSKVELFPQREQRVPLFVVAVVFRPESGSLSERPIPIRSQAIKPPSPSQ
jgi:hypothetical protein